ncbi:MAG: NERD domain-containing protein, partial [Betaproteobacteria bacterium]
ASATVGYDGFVLRFPAWTTNKPLEQAQRQAKWFSDWLCRATGVKVTALPVLALPGWYVERTARGVVRVFGGKELPGLLRTKGTTGLSPQDVQRIAFQVEQRCRNVAPAYGQGD